MRRNLVLARVGATSLHPSWIDPAAPRSWDLRLVPYQWDYLFDRDPRLLAWVMRFQELAELEYPVEGTPDVAG